METRNEKPFLLWTGAAVGISLILSLPVFDTSLSFNLRELLSDGDYQRLALGIMAVCFGVELLLLRAEKWTILKWIPVAFPVICLIPGELFWLMGGWDRLAGSILWWFGFPMLMGGGLAVLVTHLPQNRRVRALLILLLVLGVVLGAIFWPRSLGEKLILEIPGPMLLTDPEGDAEWRSVDDPGRIRRMLHYAELVPAVFPPDWKDERCVLLRLNDEWILAAEYGQAPYVYYYSGDLAEFDGTGVKWRFYHFPALYTELVTAATTAEE